jgi:hypothetical protein
VNRHIRSACRVAQADKKGDHVTDQQIRRLRGREMSTGATPAREVLLGSLCANGQQTYLAEAERALADEGDP